MPKPRPDAKARLIVLHLIRRKRAAERRLRHAYAKALPQAYSNILADNATEAQNAAEVARRLLYHGEDAL